MPPMRLLLLFPFLLTSSGAAFSNYTRAIWAPASVERGGSPNFVLLRPPTLRLRTAPSRMTVLVSAAPDAINQGQLLGRYRLFVNGVYVAVGPGRGDHNLRAHPTDSVLDRIEVPAAALAAGGRSLSVALQCLNMNSSETAWAMLEAELSDASGGPLGQVATDAHWHSYAADSIFQPGQLDTGSGHVFVNENIDARAAATVGGWRLPGFDPAAWSKAEERIPASTPTAKTTQPLAVTVGLRPARIMQVSASRYFFDMGQERMGGVVLDVPGATVAGWGGQGTEVEVRLSEMLSTTDPHAVLWPGPPFDVGNWNKIPQWSSVLTLADGESSFEQHEYIGPWRYGEIRIKNAAAKDCNLNFNLTQWSVSYPWEDEAAFSSSNGMLDRVWQLCRNTLKYTTLETFTDSNVRERMPYEADLFCAAGSYWALRSERALVRHSAQYVISNP
jgi:alpha-L-rhamnosidase